MPVQLPTLYKAAPHDLRVLSSDSVQSWRANRFFLKRASLKRASNERAALAKTQGGAATTRSGKTFIVVRPPYERDVARTSSLKCVGRPQSEMTLLPRLHTLNGSGRLPRDDGFPSPSEEAEEGEAPLTDEVRALGLAAIDESINPTEPLSDEIMALGLSALKESMGPKGRQGDHWSGHDKAPLEPMASSVPFRENKSMAAGSAGGGRVKGESQSATLAVTIPPGPGQQEQQEQQQEGSQQEGRKRTGTPQQYLGQLDASALQLAMSDPDNYLLRQSPSSSPKGSRAQTSNLKAGDRSSEMPLEPKEIKSRTEEAMSKEPYIKNHQWHYGGKGRKHRVRHEVCATHRLRQATQRVGRGDTLSNEQVVAGMDSYRGHSNATWYSDRRRKIQGREEKANAVIKEELKQVRETSDRGVAHLFEDDFDTAQKKREAAPSATVSASSPQGLANELTQRQGKTQTMSIDERRALADSLAATAPPSLHRVKPTDGSLQAIASQKQGHSFNPQAPRRMEKQIRFGVQPALEEHPENNKVASRQQQKGGSVRPPEKDPTKVKLGIENDMAFMKAWVLGSSHQL